MKTGTAIEALAADAAAQGASDIHLDFDPDAVRVRLRVDGRLRAWVPARLQPDRLRDAAWEVVDTGADRLLDWRVAAYADGEHLALRLRADRAGMASDKLTDLGMAAAQARLMVRSLERPGGAVVVAGRSGSGRRSTIASWIAGEARTLSIVAIGIEVPGALAIAVAPQLPMRATIERALMLDPDILVLGDVPDRESAAVAFQVAAGGCRVLLRLDAPDAVAAIDRLRALGVDRLALASHLIAVTAQRLADRLCPRCRQPVQASNAVAALLGFDPGAVIYESTGCGDCRGTGVIGRIGVFEGVAVDSAVARLINDGADAALLTRHLFLNAPRLDSAARSMVREGLIGATEAVRLSRGQR
ncbi:ATPase, T2SS/T4P/T4SS family [Sphingomonas sp.]|uniref:ATPase, T2SS/T4P/T4SS family n=1 Tax=Sphingomonas sp. TaxID=28214 RepID=UPI002CA2D8D5|nr:ATPase, T2SS/T4P/T4SS family [Sphingomonas sp.]HTG38260.1 ATPase, T2SS/T4P/T4SS family [Sphingomonas sp.]